MRKIAALIVVFFLHLHSFGQLNGRITTNSGNGLPGVEITNLSTGNHVHTDEKGEFSLKKVELGDTLQIFHVGYSTVLYSVKNFELLHIVFLEKTVNLEELTIEPSLNALNEINAINIQLNPVNSSQEVLRQVPGLIIGQHAGGGKAEQLFLRGFDVDHGTDINITTDGIPVNMVSHAHGQGYADLHYVIPETIERIDYGKGPYYSQKGDFTTAGYVNLDTKKSLDHSLLNVEAGQFNTFRILGMFNVLKTEKETAYLATEFISTDGPFESPQNFSRYNIFGKYGITLDKGERFGVTLSYFTSQWDASGQIPTRAVDSGMITRFGAIDSTEGGYTDRMNVIFDFDKPLPNRALLKNKFFYSNYGFELYSNFTFFLNDSVNGDQIRQKEERNILGFSSTYMQDFNVGKNSGSWQIGIQLRNDAVADNELSHTRNRLETLDTMQLGDVNQSNMGAFAEITMNFGKWTVNSGIRADYFDFAYNNHLAGVYSNKSVTESILSPKLNIMYNYSTTLQLYVKSGKGFHSNDSRVVVAENGTSILPAAYGYDAGFIWKPLKKMVINAAYWYLFLEQEFVYVGDEGIVEPSGKTRRQGIDVGLRYQPLPWLFAFADVTLNQGRTVDDPEGDNYIPLAPTVTLTGGLNANTLTGMYGGLQFRHIGDRPANEDNSIVALGYTVFDFNMGYNWKQFGVGFFVQNLLNTEWNETQFATESRLKNETSPVDEIHFTPGTPFNFRVKLQMRF